jgi:hypothetical protein
MIQCRLCSNWVHEACELYKRDEKDYNCPECRSEVVQAPSTEAKKKTDAASLPWNFSIRDNRSCTLCHEMGEPEAILGRLLAVDVDVWVHANCAIWSPEVVEREDGGLANFSSALQRGRVTVPTHQQETTTD